MSTQNLFSDDLPADAQTVLDAATRDLADVQADLDAELARIQARADEAIDQIRQRADEASATVRARATQQTTARTEALFRDLHPLMAAHAREGRLDEALAIRQRARSFRTQLLAAQPDPGNLAGYAPAEVGAELLFEVSGRTEGTIWGTDLYTSDSPVAVAAVHAGALQPGEQGVVRVTLHSGLNVAYQGSQRNGVWSHDYGDYPLAYRVARA